MVTPTDTEVVTMNGWPGGMDNRVRETSAASMTDNRNKMPVPEVLRDAVNVDITKDGKPLRRQGYERVIEEKAHSLWSNSRIDHGMCVIAGELCVLKENGTTANVAEVDPYAVVSYAEVNGEIFWSNGLQTGKVVAEANKPLSLPVPPKPDVREADGSMYAGTYTVAITYSDHEGQEYGASEEVTAYTETGLEVVVPAPWPEEVGQANVYVSRPDGEQLYLATEVREPATITIHQGMLEAGRELETAGLKPIPPASSLCYFNGRLYAARHNKVIFSDPLRYGLYAPSRGIYMFAENVILLAPTLDGLYVGTTEGVFFLSGTDPYDVTQKKALKHAPIKHTMTTLPGEFLDVAEDEVSVWWGEDGAMVAGLPGGAIRQLTKDRLAVPNFQAGAMLYREQNGVAAVVSSLRRAGEQSAMAASDSVTVEVRTNTKVLN